MLRIVGQHKVSGFFFLLLFHKTHLFKSFFFSSNSNGVLFRSGILFGFVSLCSLFLHIDLNALHSRLSVCMYSLPGS